MASRFSWAAMVEDLRARRVGVLVAAILIFTITAVFNSGFIAVDDYASNIEVVVPAQRHPFGDIVAASDFRPPFANLFLGTVTHTAALLGLSHPINQLIFLRVVLGLLSLALFLQAVKRLFKDTSSQMTALALLAFYFTSPLLFTRPLIEGMCAPWLLLSAACCVAYQRHKQLGEILLALLCLTFATLIRYQSGLCLIPLIVCFFRERRWRHITATLAAATGLFILVGLWDQALKGNFHGSLVSYFAYNRAHSSSYGVSPFPTYIFLFLLLSFPVLGLTRLGERNWRALYSPLLAPLSYFSFFVLVHSFVLHKEERFMEPVMGLFLVLWTPLIDWTKSRWRLGPAIYLNALLLFLVSTTIPQKNVIGVARFVDGHTEIRRILGLKETLVVFPRAYIERIVPEERVDAIPLSLPCDTVLALRADLSDPERLTRYTRAGIFEPGLTERLIIHLNPAKNFRRATVELWRPRGCR